MYQHPLGYLLGLQGLALLRAYNGEYDRDFTEARFADIRELLDRAGELGDGAVAEPVSAAAGYDAWAPGYDGPNDLIDLEEPVLRAIVDGLPPGVAVDAACGTGRHTGYLAARGHQVTGVDLSPGMLAVARGKVPGADFREGDLHHLPVADEDADLVTCALALTHMADLGPVFTEFARVLRPGGSLVISDSRMDYRIVSPRPGGKYGYLPHHKHHTSEYLTAALPAGLEVRHCEELRRPWADPADAPAAQRDPPEAPCDFWPLRSWYPAAHRGAQNGSPMLIFWHFQKAGRPPGSR